MTQDDQVPNIPDLSLAQKRFLALSSTSQQQKDAMKKELLEHVKKESKLTCLPN